MFSIWKLSSFPKILFFLQIWKFENESPVPQKQFRINTLVTFE